MDDPIVAALALVLIGEFLVALWCVRQSRERYAGRLIRSIVWDRLIAGDRRVVAAGALILGPTTWGFAVFLLGWPPIPRPWGVVAVAIGLMLLFFGPISTYRLIRRIERGARSDGS